MSETKAEVSVDIEKALEAVAFDEEDNCSS
jgi:hypothetical protein